MITLPASPTLPDNARVGYHNLVADAEEVTATSAADGFPVVNLANDLTYLYWRAGSAAAQTITIDLGSAQAVDYLGIARHNLGSAGSTYILQRSSDASSWETVASGAPTDDGILMHEFTSQTYRYWRLMLGAGSKAQQIAVVYLGEILVMERRIYVGHVPLPFGLKSEVSTGRSEQGQYLGRVVRRQFYETGMSFQNIDPDWCRENIDPFHRTIVNTAFFWAWRPTSYPDEVGYVWAMGDVNPANQRPNGMMQFDVAIQGIIE